MTKEEFDFIGALNMCDEISNEAYKKIMCHCEEQEPCEDTISRQAVLQAVSKGCQEWRGIYGRCEEFINALPPVNPQEPKTGHWIYHRDWKVEGECPYECSECGRAYDYEMNYCGYCGIKMESEE